MINKEKMLEKYQSLLKAYSLDNTLKRGYSIVYKDGCIVNSDKQLNKGADIDIKLYDGGIKATVKEKHHA